MILRLLLPLLAFLIAAPALAQPVASASSPSGSLKVELSLNGEGRIGYTVSRNGTPVLNESRLGFLLTDAPQLLRSFALTSQSTSSASSRWEQPWGEYRFIDNRYNELVAEFRETTRLKRSLRVVFRIYDDGIGFRYEVPKQANLQIANIADELTEFSIAEDGEAWWSPGFEWNREEYLYNRTPVTQVAIAQTPITIRTKSGLHLSIHEAALVNYSGMNVRRSDGRVLKAALTPSSKGPKVTRQTPFATPWRVVMIAPTAPALYESAKIILNLNEPNVLGDVSWVEPRKYVGIWWGMHLETQSWNSGPKHGATTQNAKQMIDFAAANGFKGVLIEGWNEGWDGDWFGWGDQFDFTKAYPDFDLPTVAAYARAKGVRIVGHHETGGNIAVYERQLGPALDLYQRLGVDSVKTGYVSDAGGIQAAGANGAIDREWHEGQRMVEHHLKVVVEAAKRRISINAHEPVKDTGLRRTYPNWISREGQRGTEYQAWGEPKNPPEHEANLVFTRMLSGPMDFTPGILSLKGKNNTPIPSTLAKQLADYVVIYSPIQMAADLPENYAANRPAFQFIKDVAVDWDDSRMLSGEVGDFAVFARKDRRSANWFVGAVGDELERRVDVPLSFLQPGRRYRAEIYRDGDTADYKTNPRDLVIEKRTVTSKGSLQLRLAPGGGAAIRFVALGR